MPTVERTPGSIEEGTVYSKSDANPLKVPLDSNSRKLTT